MEKQTPFWWETPHGDRILTWNGEHYMFGNDLGLIPGLGGSYTIKDELDTRNGVTFDMAEIRMKRYFARLAADGFEFPFVPVMASGLPTDNGSPNPRMMEFINAWNEKNGDEITIVPATLEDFFNALREYDEAYPDAIPVYRGDWPDWWTDGAISTPKHVQVYREAQRVYEKVKKMDPYRHIVSQKRIEDMEYELALFAEHTWGYHSSVSEPWNPFVQELGVRKEAYAANASKLAHTALYDILEAKGDALLSPDRPMRFKVHNPYDNHQSDHAHLIMEGWHLQLIKDGFHVVDEQDESVYPAQMTVAPRGVIVRIPMALQPNETRTVRILPTNSLQPTTAFQKDYVGSDRMMDMMPLETEDVLITPTYAETPYVRIAWKKGDGITEWLNKKTTQNMLRADRNHNAFTPVYDVTKAEGTNQMDVRRKMGRNRKGPDAMISEGTLVEAKVIESGQLFGKVQLIYEVAGCSHYSLLLTLYADRPRVDVAVRLHKDSVWDPENLYVSLPFGSDLKDKQKQLWIDKGEALLRPRFDQLPGSLADYYCVDEGVYYTTGNEGIVIAMPDTPLIQIGSLAYETRLLNDHPRLNDEPAHLYAWTMSNYWETNFAPTLGGFYEFRYLITWGEQYAAPEQAFKTCRNLNHGLLAWRIK
ncbi:glycoside hydrolase [Bacillaceae bacterium SIJ1]|nr:glycoside hydrolase [Litoribacterium kuwaitense]NGP44799.1 glycoside hydrolase [Litoribacterium kuwaitense]